MCPCCRVSVQISESLSQWDLLAGLICFVQCLGAHRYRPPIPVHWEQAWRIWERTWLQLFLPELALTHLNDCTRRISQLHRNGYLFQHLYQFDPHPAGRLREALRCDSTDTAGAGILQPLCGSFVSLAHWEQKYVGDFWFDSSLCKHALSFIQYIDRAPFASFVMYLSCSVSRTYFKLSLIPSRTNFIVCCVCFRTPYKSAAPSMFLAHGITSFSKVIWQSPFQLNS